MRFFGPSFLARAFLYFPERDILLFEFGAIFEYMFVKHCELKTQDTVIHVELIVRHIQEYGYVGVGEMCGVPFRPSDKNGNVFACAASRRLILMVPYASACAHA